MKKVGPISAGHWGESNVFEVGELHRETTDTLQQLAKDICNLVFMDVDIPGLTSIEAASIVKAAYPEINVILLTIREDSKTVSQVQVPEEGIHLDKIPPVTLSEFLSRVYETALHSNQLAVDKVLAFFRERPAVQSVQQDTYGLSPREKEILRCLVDGDTYKQISEHCHISVGTVRSHIMNIYRKLEVNSRSNAIVKAMKEHLI
ncbi:DNA-binding NarL/FixJ family response regulator [Chitinophaga dinghuensis]|uniref:DNA-binding NarL/FixJ family response regulator n=1 Tax=Chitinophaga dinghuensis TaxID=1539050 RepID=A0A327WBX6_9BACT|nr:response regulator transcription factor [Chitinophaga dinghuensis]RAJ87342.1 DNA-binding NarL/FixJ family response regulator [Chitinophaga dinghuensis]